VTIENFELTGSDGIDYLASNGGTITFYPNIYTYDVSVPYNVESMSLAMTALAGTVYGNGTKSFGENDALTFEAYLVSQSGEVESSHYIVNVTRMKAISDNTLSYIKINGKLIDGFDSATTQYNMDIDYGSMAQIVVSAAATDSTAQIMSGVGTYTLAEGNNVCSIVVKAQDGTTRTYNVVISYLNSNALLSSLSLEGSQETVFSNADSVSYNFDFDPDSNEYTVMVDKDINSINVKGEAEDQLGAAIIGLGKYQLDEDNNKITISVVSADGVSTMQYVLNVVKTYTASGNSKLASLTIGGHDLVFNSDDYYYTLSVDNDTDGLDISAIAQDVNASVTISGNTELAEGQNAVLVTVKAENGNTSVYELVVTKDEKPDFFFTMLLIILFLLWMLTVAYLFYKSYAKDKKKDKMKTYFN
jgi:hypothetical protein